MARGRRRTWLLPVGLWVVAVALAGTAAWAVPRAADSRDLRDEIRSLSAKAAEMQDRADESAENLEVARGEASDLEARTDQVEKLREKLLKAIRRMLREIEDLTAQIAAASSPEPAPAPAPAPSEEEEYPVLGPPEPPKKPCTPYVDPETGEEGEVCE